MAWPALLSDAFPVPEPVFPAEVLDHLDFDDEVTAVVGVAVTTDVDEVVDAEAVASGTFFSGDLVGDSPETEILRGVSEVEACLHKKK